MVTAEQVWAAIGKLPDPELPVVSLAELGVVRAVEVEAGRVHVELAPTFLGCPALDAMRSALEEAIAGLGGEPDVEVLLDDAWTTERITPAGREKLRAAGVAPPGRRLLELDSTAFRCPYCDSSSTRLENLFGPTACRSIRYCETCRQPFEQFKTL